MISDQKAYLLIKLFLAFLGIIPGWLSLIIADKISRLWFLLDKRHREITMGNLTCAFGQSMNINEIERLTKKIFKNIVMVLFEFGWAENLDNKEFSKYFTIKGVENLHKASKKGKGILALTAHTGNWEFGTIAFSMTGYSGSAVYRRLDYAPLDRIIREGRERMGGEMFPLGEARKTIIDNLNKGMLVGILLDQGVDWYKGVYVNFFGRLACTNTGLAKTALMTNAPVVPMFNVREGNKYILEIGHEIPLVKTGDRTKDIEINTQNYTTVIEDFIRRYPDQWFWVHDRWKYKPYCKWPR